eukprot:c20883_g1_i2 orf=129-842(+)
MLSLPRSHREGDKGVRMTGQGIAPYNPNSAIFGSLDSISHRQPARCSNSYFNSGPGAVMTSRQEIPIKNFHSQEDASYESSEDEVQTSSNFRRNAYVVDNASENESSQTDDPEGSTIDSQEKNQKKIDEWIEKLKDRERVKPSSLVVYSKPMPNVHKLMKEWPKDVEKVLQEADQLSTKSDMDLEPFVDLCCSILGIPVHESRVESLHCMFTLFLELKNKQSSDDKLNLASDTSVNR